MDARPSDVAGILVTLGCPQDRADVMAAQLVKRAGQLAQERGWSAPEAMAHLLRLMAGGWAAQARGVSPDGLGTAPASPSHVTTDLRDIPNP
ncbi:MAG: hypothetical protein WCR07_00030 [Verrucomicrobiota bacterium]|jgi:hypothetical protein